MKARRWPAIAGSFLAGLAIGLLVQTNHPLDQPLSSDDPVGCQITRPLADDSKLAAQGYERAIADLRLTRVIESRDGSPFAVRHLNSEPADASTFWHVAMTYADGSTRFYRLAPASLDTPLPKP